MIQPPPSHTLFPYTTLFRSPGVPEQMIGRRVLPIGSAGCWAERKQTPLSWCIPVPEDLDRKSTRLNSSHVAISYAVFCLKKKKKSVDSRRGRKLITLTPDRK